MFKTSLLDTLEVGTIKALSQIHKCLFEEIYDFAGKVRDVNIAKGGFRFAPFSRGEREKCKNMAGFHLRTPIKDVEIKFLLKGALIDRIHDREIYIKGIDASYHYEGYYVYKTEDFHNE